MRVLDPMWNLHLTIPMPEISVPCAMPIRVLGSERGVMGPTKYILYGEMDILSPVSKMMVSNLFEAG